MSKRDDELVLVTHMGHDGPWLLTRTRKEVRERIAQIKSEKPEAKRLLRLKLLKVVDEPLSPKLARAYATWKKADAAWEKADAAWEKVIAAWEKAGAAWEKTDAAWNKAYAAREKANAAWAKAINSREGVAFHAKACGCAWTVEEPDILMQLRAQEAR